MNEEPERFYELLGVRPGTSAHEIKEAYERLTSGKAARRPRPAPAQDGYCTVRHKTKIVPPAEPAKSSRLKSVGKTLAAPFN